MFSWIMYDWANSPFGSTVVTTFLGPYLAELARAQGGFVYLFGYGIEADAFFPYCVSLSVGMQVLFLPILGTLADYTPLKKTLLLTFAYTGAIATILLFLVQGDLVVLGGLLFLIANLSFGAALVFYNAFLPDIASPDNRDRVSSQGFGYGYTGGGVLLVINILMVNFMADTGLAVRLSLASAGVWWLFFTLIFPQRHLRQRQPEGKLPAGSNYLTHSLKEFFASLKEMYHQYPKTLRFLIGYLIYNDGIQTVIVASGLFAVSELGMGYETLVIVILFIQFVAAAGAWLFNLVAARIGAKWTIIFNLMIWAAAVIYAYGFLYTELQFWILGFATGLVLGSSQALSRSLFSQMIPENRESAYFGLYEISERGTSWIGPVVFGTAVQMTGSSRVAILPIIAFFIIGMIILYFTDVRAAIQDAGNEVPVVV
ncbi:MAG TPA: MFS transporter [Anaerolineae bacterium]|nr:MFS transporter [Anaerolineae bacterium]